MLIDQDVIPRCSREQIRDMEFEREFPVGEGAAYTMALRPYFKEIFDAGFRFANELASYDRWANCEGH